MNQAKKLAWFKRSSLAFWLISHLAGAGVVLFFHSPALLSWIVYYFVLFSPIYIFVVHRLDARFKFGGVLSVGNWMGMQTDREKKTPEASRPDRPGLARQTVTITTGFAVLLAFQAVRFHGDLFKAASSRFLNILIGTVAFLFALACISNLLQMLFHQFLAQPLWSPAQKESFRRKLNVLRSVSWHFLLSAVILILCMLPYPWLWLCYAVNLFYGVLLYWYYFSIPAPEGFPSGT